MRAHFRALGAAVALLAAPVVVLGLASCGPDASEAASATASPRTTAPAPSPAPAPPSTVPPDSPPSPTPTPLIIRSHVHRHIRTPCFGGIPETSSAFVRWSGNGSAIVFNRGSDVVWVTSDGSALQQFEVTGPMTAVDVSPDGTQIVYSTCAYPTRPGFTYTPSTRRGTDADGNTIIFIDSVDPNPELLNYDHELVRAQIDGSEPQRLTTNARFDNYPAWSPDGTRIAYVSATASSAEAARISIMSPTALTFGGRHSDWQAWPCTRRPGRLTEIGLPSPDRA